MDKFSELSRPVRIHRDWNRASMCHCGKCDRWKMTIADADGVQTCASCYDAEWLSEWQNYAEAAEKRITELEGQLHSGFTPEALAQEERAENAEQRVAELEEVATDYAGKFQKAQDAAKHLIIMSNDAEKRITELEAEGKVWESAALKHLERAEEAEKRLATPVRFPDCDIEAVSIMAHWLSDEEVNAWVKGIEFAKTQILAAGFTFSVEGDE